MEIGNLGFIRLVDYMGDDLRVVNAARISLAKDQKVFTDADEKLLKYLAQHKHTSPFRHCFVTLHVRAPEYVARQWYKHCIGTEYSFKDTGWNEMSGRYVTYDPELAIPDYFRMSSKSIKQGSIDVPHPENDMFMEKVRELNNQALELYDYMISEGIPKEQARTVLPVSFFTEFYWTASLQALAHFCNLRLKADSQKEIRQFAETVAHIVSELYPKSFPLLIND